MSLLVLPCSSSRVMDERWKLDQDRGTGKRAAREGGFGSFPYGAPIIWGGNYLGKSFWGQAQ
jgi:hypothetical protein